MPGTMRAALLVDRPAHELSLRVMERPEPAQDDDVVVAVEACGVCGTDLHIMDGQAYRPELPFVLGHEIVGRVVVPAQSPRQELVAIWPFRGCGSCLLCAQGKGQLCSAQVSVTGVRGACGGFAEYVVVKRDQLVAVPDGIGASAAAAVVDAGTTALNAVEALPERSAGLHVVVGGGPVGFCVAELLGSDERAVLVVERQAMRRRLGEERGFAVAAELDAVPEAPSVVIDCGGGDALTWAVGALRPQGIAVVVAYRAIDRFDTTEISRKELTVRGVRSGSVEQLRRTLGLAARGAIGAFPLREWALAEVSEALVAARAGDPAKPVIIIPDNAPAAWNG